MKTVAIAIPPMPVRFRAFRQLNDRFTKALLIQATEHFGFDQTTGTWRPVWCLDHETFLPITTDNDPYPSEESKNRNELRVSIQDEVKQTTYNLMRTYLKAHHGGSKPSPYSLSVIRMITWHEFQMNRGVIDRAELKASLQEIAFFNLHPRAVALTLIEDVESFGPLSREFPIIQDIVKYIALPYVQDDPYYGTELQVTVAAAGGACDLKIVSGHGIGHKDEFVRFI